MGDDDLPGDFSSLDGMKQRAEALGEPRLPEFIDRAIDRISRDEERGYLIEPPADDPSDAEMLFHIGILAGAALEREYPAVPIDDSETYECVPCKSMVPGREGEIVVPGGTDAPVWCPWCNDKMQPVGAEADPS